MRPTVKSFVVYMATNTVNGKRYVGATSKGIDGRSRQHSKDAKRKGKTRDCPRFYDAIRKHGFDVFEWTTLATLSTSEEMYKEEECLIASLKPEYNIASGGLIFTSKEKQAEIGKVAAQWNSKPVICLNDGSVYPSGVAAEKAFGLGRKVVGFQCKRGGITRDGLAFSFINGAMSEQERADLLSDRRSKKIVAEKARVETVTRINSRSVTDLNTGIIYTSATDADRSLNLIAGTSEACCRRKRATRRGECFAFGQLSESERLHFLALAVGSRKAIDAGWKEKIGKNNSRIVICETTNMLYDNLGAAANDHGVSTSTIFASCHSGKATRSGVSFSYLDEWCPNPL